MARARDQRGTTEDRAIAPDQPQQDDDPKAEETRPAESTGEGAFGDRIGDEVATTPVEVASPVEAGSDESPAPPTEEAVATPEDADTSGESSAGDEQASEPAVAKKAPLDWAHETSGHRIEGELSKIEAEVRGLLSDRDTRRKRKLTGTRRWLELEDDIIAWRYSGKIDEPSLDRLKELVRRRHYLFTRLSFLAGTRPTWNS